MTDVKVDASAPAAAVATAAAAAPKLEGAALHDALRAQLEFYFSKQNLATDSYLLSQMNAHPKRSVPIDILAGFRKIKSLTDSKTAIIAALKQCQNLALDEATGLVRSTLKTERSTLILRDMPADASEAELRAAFESRPNSLCAGGKLVSLTPDVNDTWFVTFDSESTCMEVCMDIQSNAFTETAYTYRTRPLQARVKNESLNRGFYTAPTNAGSGVSALLIGGPVNGPAGVQYHPHYAMPGGYYYPQQYAGYAVPNQAYLPMGVPAPAAGVPQTKAEKKAAQAAAQAAQQATAAAKKEKKKAAAAAAAAAPAAGEVATNADGTVVAPAPKKKKSKAAKAAADAIVPPVAITPPAAPQVQDKSHLVALYGHAPRLYSREQVAQVVEQFITMARANSAVMKRPDGFAQASDAEKSVLKDKPSTSFSILDPFPVIYPASPSPLLAAQPHHSSSLPFLELGSGALDAPYFAANSGFAAGAAPDAAAAAGARRKSVVKGAEGAKKAATKPRPASAAAPQPKIVPPPAVQPPASILAAAAATSAPAATTATPAAAAAAPTKPVSFAAAALAAGNAPQQPAPVKAAPKPVAPKAAPTAAAAGEKAAPAAKKAPKKKAAASAPAPSAAAPAPVVAPVAAKPTVPNYASRVGVIPQAEVAAKVAAQKQAKEAAERAKNPPAAAAAAPVAAATPSAAKETAAAPAVATTKEAAAAPAAATTQVKTPETPSKPAFSYAAMIKKAPVTPAPVAAAPRVQSTPAAAPAPAAAVVEPAATDATVAAKAETSSWRVAQ